VTKEFDALLMFHCGHSFSVRELNLNDGFSLELIRQNLTHSTAVRRRSEFVETLCCVSRSP
jgi:hypothetical protein